MTADQSDETNVGDGELSENRGIVGRSTHYHRSYHRSYLGAQFRLQLPTLSWLYATVFVAP